jgi:MFS family permease
VQSQLRAGGRLDPRGIGRPQALRTPAWPVLCVCVCRASGAQGAGLGILPLTVPIVVGGRHAGRLARRVGLDATIALAFAFVGGGLLGLSTSGTQTPYAAYAAWLAVTGLGITLALPTLSAVIAGSLPPAQAGVGTGLQATTREFGSALGVAVIGTVFTARFVAALPPDIRAGHDPHTVAQALAATTPERAADVIAAFLSAAGTGLRVIGVTVLVLGALVVLHALLSRRAKSSPAPAEPRREPPRTRKKPRRRCAPGHRPAETLSIVTVGGGGPGQNTGLSGCNTY